MLARSSDCIFDGRIDSPEWVYKFSNFFQHTNWTQLVTSYAEHPVLATYQATQTDKN